MNAITGFAEILLSSSELAPEHREWIQKIQKSAIVMTTLLSDILHISQLEAGKLSLNPKPFNFIDTIFTVADILNLSVLEKNLQFAVFVDPQCPKEVVGDEMKIRQVLLNLVSNAIKFTDEGFVQISLHVGDVDEDGNSSGSLPKKMFSIQVLDSGVGIPQEKRSLIFEKFTQLRSSDSNNRGIGLGLAICKSLMDLMGSSIDVGTGEAGVGSSFTAHFKLPVFNFETFSSKNIKQHSVLYVECDTRHAKAVVQFFRRIGLKCYRVKSEQEALDFDQSSNPITLYIISLDTLSIPAETVKDLRKQSESKVVILADVRDWAQINSLKSEIRFDRAFTKPFNVFEFLQSNLFGSSSKLPKFSFRVLVVEDNTVNQLVMSNMLKRLGCSVKVVGDGVEAVEIVQKQTFDVVFMDIMMPRMDGIEATRRIRELGFSSLTVVAITAKSTFQDNEECQRAGMSKFFSKPIIMRDLISLLESL